MNKRGFFTFFGILFLSIVLVTNVWAGGDSEKTGASVATGEPQYGGTVTALGTFSHQDPLSWDPYDGSSPRRQYVDPFMEGLVGGDVINRGPRGTGDATFTSDFIPESLLTGVVAKSWEWTTPETLTFHLHEGVMFYANPNWSFESREMTAEDVAFSINRFRGTPMGQTWVSWIDKAEAVDRYTVEFHCNRFTSAWFNTLYEYNLDRVYPPELAEADMHNWKNQVGTGAFKLVDYVKDVNVVYGRNPDWWNRKQIIDGKEYELPFVDKVVYPIMVDEGTRIAALRTARVDLLTTIPMAYKETLTRTSPDLKLSEWYNGSMHAVMFQWRDGPWLDKNLRHALSIAMDRQAIIDAIWIEGAVQGYPLSPCMSEIYYTPLEELPKHLQTFHSNDPDLAKRMVIDAGYENGLSMELVVENTVATLDLAAMLKEQWGKIGVDVTIKSVESAYVYAVRGSGEFKDAIIHSTGAANPEGHLEFWIGAPFAAEGNIEPEFKAAVQEMVKMRDPVERAAECKRLVVERMDLAWHVGTATATLMSAYWPWVGNYYGETKGWSQGLMPVLAHMWIDQGLKKELGF